MTCFVCMCFVCMCFDRIISVPKISSIYNFIISPLISHLLCFSDNYNFKDNFQIIITYCHHEFAETLLYLISQFTIDVIIFMANVAFLQTHDRHIQLQNTLGDRKKNMLIFQNNS
jgi:hypothetical protein